MVVVVVLPDAHHGDACGDTTSQFIRADPAKLVAVIITQEDGIRPTRDDLADPDGIVVETPASPLTIRGGVQNTREPQLDTNTNITNSDGHCFFFLFLDLG